MDTDEVESEDVHDAVGELANQVGGLIKGKLAPKSLLSLPTITEGIELSVDIPHCKPIGSVTLESEGVPLRIEVWHYIPDA
jgi:chemotaxis protein CheX